MKGCVFREIQNTVKIFRLQTLKVYIYQPVILQTPGRPDKVVDITKHQHTTFQLRIDGARMMESGCME